MGKETKSRTEKETYFEESLFGLGSHYKTTIDGVTERGRTSEESQKRASEKYHKE